MVCAVPGRGPLLTSVPKLSPNSSSRADHPPRTGLGPWAASGCPTPWDLSFNSGFSAVSVPRQGHRLPWAPRRGAWGTGLRGCPPRTAGTGEDAPTSAAPIWTRASPSCQGSLKRGQDLEPLWGGRTQALAPAQPAGRQPHLQRVPATGKPSPALGALARFKDSSRRLLRPAFWDQSRAQSRGPRGRAGDVRAPPHLETPFW